LQRNLETRNPGANTVSGFFRGFLASRFVFLDCFLNNYFSDFSFFAPLLFGFDSGKSRLTKIFQELILRRTGYPLNTQNNAKEINAIQEEASSPIFRVIGVLRGPKSTDA
jgi:hypothetical protein